MSVLTPSSPLACALKPAAEADRLPALEALIERQRSS